LDQTVEIIEGPCRDSLRKLQQQGARAFGIVFIDHAKVLYLHELKLCEQLGIVKPGTTVIADDMIQPGNAAYSAYVRESPELKQQFEKAEASTSEGDVSLGNPALIYETSLIDGREPSGNDVSEQTIILMLQLLTSRTKGRSRDSLVQRNNRLEA
jgi:catechol O-methyltransferase